MSDNSIYEVLKAAGIPMDSHEGDLYVKVTPQSTEILEKYKYRKIVTSFISQIDHASWYDIPFAYEPFWDSKQASNPLFQLYCKSLNKLPQDVIRENICNGTHMLEFTLWSNNKAFQFRNQHPEYTCYAKIFNWEAYDSWLENNYKDEEINGRT